MIAGPSKRLKHAAKSCCKLFIAGLSHALQQGNLLLFDAAVYHKVIEIHCGHGQSFGSLRGATTKQAHSDSAHAKHVDETLHDYVHMFAPIPRGDEG